MTLAGFLALEQRAEDRHEGEKRSRRGPEALFDILGQRLNLVAEVERGEHQRQDDERDRGQPLVVAPDQAVLVAGGAQTHQMDRGDVGGEQRGADDGPAQRPAGQKVSLARHRRATRHPQADNEDADHVGDDDDQIEDGDLQFGGEHGVGTVYTEPPWACGACSNPQ